MLALIALGGSALLAGLALAALVAGYAVLRRRFLAEVAGRAVRAERRRLAEDLHDLIGHDLALIAVQAATLEVQHPGEVATDAAAIRSGAQRATESLRELTGLLGAGGSGEVHRARTEPTGRSVDQILRAARQAGITVHADLDQPDEVSEVVALTLARIVREVLTNASKHAPGEPVTLRLEREGNDVVLTAVNATGNATGPQRPTGVPGTGLASVRSRVELLGGELESGVESGLLNGPENASGEARFAVRARLPVTVRVEPDPEAGRPPSPGRELARRGWPYLVTAAVVVLGFYTWATHGCTLEPGPRAALVVGSPAVAAQAVLPGRQAPVRLYRTPPAPAGAACRQYTDGNFPLGLATVRVCIAGGVVVAVDDLDGNRS